MDVFCVGIVERVELQDNSFGQTGSCGRNAAGCGQIDVVVIAYFLNIAHFEDSPVDVTIESVAQFLCHVTQMQVVIRNLT